MKKRILMLTLVLMIVLSSFSIVFGESFYITQPMSYYIPLLVNDNNPTTGKYNIYDKNGRAIFTGIGGAYRLGYFTLTNFRQGWANPENNTTHNYYITSPVTLTLDHYPLYVTNNQSYVPYTPGTTTPVYNQDGWTNDPALISISIKPSQRILFNYAPADKDKFLKSLSCTPDKSITVHQGYYSGGQVTDLVIKKDTTGNFIGGSPVTLASFPAHRALNTNEYLGYSQANGGNWVWTDYIPGSSGGPVGTDSNSLVTFTIDTRYCSYRVVSANTGLEITSGGIADVPQVPDDGIYNNNQNPWGPGDITDDYLLDRADYEDGIIGDIQYGFDTLFKFLKMPFELLYKFIMTLGEIIQYALGTVSGFTTALQGIYAILPGPIWFLVIMAISINVFKLIFGR